MLPVKTNVSKIKQRILKQLREAHLLSKTEFIILFGSVPEGRQNPLSDIDVCISLQATPKERLRTRMELLGKLPDRYDIQIFEDLPLYVKKSVLGGTLLYCKNQTKTHQRAIQVLQEYEDFEPLYLQHIEREMVTA